MSDIRKTRQLLSEATQTQVPEFLNEHDRIPGPEVFDFHGGAELLNIYTSHYEELDEGTKEALGKVFGSMKNASTDLYKATGAVAKNKLKQIIRKSDFNGSQMRQMKKQIKELTKKVVDLYYSDLVAVTNAHKQRGTLYSGPFFKELVQSFKLEPEVEKHVRREFKQPIGKFLSKVKAAFEEYQERNPDAKPKRPYAYYQGMPVLYRNKLRDEVNSLLGSMVKFAAANSVAQNFKENPPEFTESVSDDTQFLQKLNNVEIYESVSRLVLDKEVDELFESFQNHTEEKIREYLDGKDFTDEELRDDIEDVHETIYDQYVRRY